MKTEAEINAEKHAKPRVDIVPPALMLAAGRALGYGADKHGVPEGYDGFGTWRIPGTQQAEVLTHYACLMRHLLLWRGGEIIDPVEHGGSGLPHLDHAAAQLAILLDLLERPPHGSDAAVQPEPADPWPLPEGWSWIHTGIHWVALHDPPYTSAHHTAAVSEIVARRNGGQVVPPAPPADPWALPEGCKWEWDAHDLWAIWAYEGGLWLPGGREAPMGFLCHRPDAPSLIELLRRRNAAEPNGSAVTP